MQTKIPGTAQRTDLHGAFELCPGDLPAAGRADAKPGDVREQTGRTNAPDRCKPRNPQGISTPALQIGTGQSYYLPLQKDQVLQAEAGPQGGHHIWIATRMKNLKQAGSTTKISGVQPGTGTVIPPTTLAFTYAPDEGGFCKLYGIRYQLDNEGVDYKQFLGKPLDLTVTVTDSAGATVTETTRVQIAPTLVGAP